MSEPPVYGPNGAVMIAPHLTVEMREEIENPEFEFSLKGLVVQIAVAMLFLAASKLTENSEAPKNLSIAAIATFVVVFCAAEWLYDRARKPSP